MTSDLRRIPWPPSTRTSPSPHPPTDVWDAVRDFGALHTRLVPGFVLDTKLDGEARIVSFANGTVARELLVDCDDARRRLVYAVISERVTQHSASVQVIADGEARCRLLWTVDVLPHEIAPYMNGQMDQAAAAMQKAFDEGARVTDRQVQSVVSLAHDRDLSHRSSLVDRRSRRLVRPVGTASRRRARKEKSHEGC